MRRCRGEGIDRAAGRGGADHADVLDRVFLGFGARAGGNEDAFKQLRMLAAQISDFIVGSSKGPKKSLARILAFIGRTDTIFAPAREK